METLTYPYGAGAHYTYGYVDFDVSNDQYHTTVVTGKDVSLGGTWTYDYSPGSNGAYDETNVSTPAGAYKYVHVGASKGRADGLYAIGLLMGKTVYESSAGVGRVEQLNNQWNCQVISNEVDKRPSRFSDGGGGSVCAPILGLQGIERDGRNYNKQYANSLETAPSEFDQYGNPPFVIETGNIPSELGGPESRRTDFTYFHQTYGTDTWLVHLVKDETVRDAGVVDSATINYATTRTFTPSGNLLTETKSGVTTRYDYWSTGDVHHKTDAQEHITEYLDYSRGIPRQEISQANAGKTITVNRTVNPRGTIASVTDGANHTTGYSYDPFDRLTGIDYPIHSDVVISYTGNTRTLTRGSYQEIVRADGLGRPVCVMRRDTVSGARVTVQTSYDAVGNKDYVSQPSAQADCDTSITLGTHYSYDVLGRVRRVTNADGTFKQYDYNGGTVTITDERQNATELRYSSYGDPDEKWLSATRTSEGVMTVIDRNKLGLVTYVSQAEDINHDWVSDAVTTPRSYRYDGRFYLTSVSNPETGVTAYGRDQLGNMISKAVGSSSVTNFIYDWRNRLETIDYPSTTSDVTYQYWDNDLLRSVSNSQAAGSVLRTYIYDANDSLINETLQISNKTYSVDYNRDALDYVESIDYPYNSRTITYTPDALGRPAKALPYVTNVEYHPTGAVRTMTYANGVVTNVGLDPNRLWPQTVRATRAGSPVIDMTYQYDDVGNVEQFLDVVKPENNLLLGYDGMDRLTNASGPWGSGNVDYDMYGNIRQKILGNETIDYTYQNQKLSGVTRNGNSSDYIGYDNYGNLYQWTDITGLPQVNNLYFHNDASELYSVNKSGTLTNRYEYDGNHQMVRSRVGSPNVTTIHFYAKSGNLLGDYTDTTGVFKQEYVYLADKLVASIENTAPVVNINVLSGNYEGTTVTLNGSASTAFSSTITTYAWSRISGPAVTLTNANSAVATFTAPQVSGTTDLVMRLTITDSKGVTASKDVTVSIWDSVPPPMLSNIQTQQGMGKNRITWTPVPQATSYNVYWSTSPGVTPSTGNAITGLTTPQYTHTGLTNGQTYYYVVVGVNQFGEGTSYQVLSMSPGVSGWGRAYSLTPPAGTPYSHARVAMDANGRAVAVWSQLNPGSTTISSVYASNYNPATGWSSPVVIFSGSGGVVRDMAVDQATGCAIVAIASQATAVTYKPGVGWAAPQRLDNVAGTLRQTQNPKVAMSAAGKALVMWEEQVPESGSTVWYVRAARYDFVSEQWDTPVSIYPGASPSDIVMDDNGNALAVWKNGSGFWSARYDGASAAWTVLTHPFYQAGTLSDIDLAMNGGGQAVAVWISVSSGVHTVYSAYYNTDEWYSNRYTLSTGGTIGGKYPKASMGPNGDATAVWFSQPSQDWVVQTSRSSAGGAWSGAQTLATLVNYTPIQMDIASNAGGDVLATWAVKEIQSSQELYVWSNHYTETSGWAGTSLLDHAPQVASSGPLLSTALSNNDDGIAAWWANDGSSTKLMRMAHYWWVDAQDVDQSPTANAGMDQTTSEGTVVALDGSTSTDIEGPLTYSWIQTAGPAVTLVNANTAAPSFTAPNVSVNTPLSFTLTVTDSGGLTATDSVTITVQMLDTDTDGMSDVWEQQHFNGISILPTGDADGDGVSNLNEYTQQTNPLDGDLNADAALNVADLLLAHRHVLGLALLNATQEAALDLAPAPQGRNGVIDVGDLVVLQRRVLAAH